MHDICFLSFGSIGVERSGVLGLLGYHGGCFTAYTPWVPPVVMFFVTSGKFVFGRAAIKATVREV